MTKFHWAWDCPVRPSYLLGPDLRPLETPRLGTDSNLPEALHRCCTLPLWTSRYFGIVRAFRAMQAVGSLPAFHWVRCVPNIKPSFLEAEEVFAVLAIHRR